MSRFVMAVLIGCVMGAGVGVWLRGLIRPLVPPGPLDEAEVVFPAEPSAPRRASWEASPAQDYVRAFQEQDWDAVIERTLWMRDRLSWVMLDDGSPGAEENARAELRARLADRDEAGNQLRADGIEDQYVLSPLAELEAIGADKGHEDLARPVARRIWFRATYPFRLRAPRGADNLAIRSMTVGVNVSDDGYILKANVIGNLDILWDRISYEWNTETGD